MPRYTAAVHEPVRPCTPGPAGARRRNGRFAVRRRRRAAPNRGCPARRRAPARRQRARSAHVVERLGALECVLQFVAIAERLDVPRVELAQVAGRAWLAEVTDRLLDDPEQLADDLLARGVGLAQAEHAREQQRVAEGAAGEHDRPAPVCRHAFVIHSGSFMPPEMITGTGNSANSFAASSRSGAPLCCTCAERGWKVMAETPASSTSRCATAYPSCSPFFTPERNFTVTGRPEPSRAAFATATAVSGSLSIAAPAPSP